MIRIKQLRIHQIKEQSKLDNYAAKYPSPQEVTKQTGNSNNRNSKLMKRTVVQVVVIETPIKEKANIQKEFFATRKLTHSNSSPSLFHSTCGEEAIEESKNDFSSPTPSPKKPVCDYSRSA